VLFVDVLHAAVEEGAVGDDGDQVALAEGAAGGRVVADAGDFGGPGSVVVAEGTAVQPREIAVVLAHPALDAATVARRTAWMEICHSPPSWKMPAPLFHALKLGVESSISPGSFKMTPVTVSGKAMLQVVKPLVSTASRFWKVSARVEPPARSAASARMLRFILIVALFIFNGFTGAGTASRLDWAARWCYER
jgi:hypothetical protein